MTAFDSTLPLGGDPVTVHICTTLESFHGFGGPEGLRNIQGFARSSSGIIVMKSPELLGPGADYAAILRHELIHVLLARNTDPAHLPRWLNEGLAMSLSREFRWQNQWQLATLYWQGNVIPYDRLDSVFEAPGNETRFGEAYAQALSMTNHLRGIAGENAVWAMLGDLREMPFDNALQKRTGLTGDEFFGRWKGSLWRVALVSSIVSGFTLFQVAALLLILAYIRKRLWGRRRVRQWMAEEKDEDEVLFGSDLEGRDPPGPWEEEDDR